ncbi:MAG: ABC transporter ATP-binding protein [Erysipelothrix sp.]|nr:ABC transporter ATP-binding protein [Erysipelothrix sp.]
MKDRVLTPKEQLNVFKRLMGYLKDYRKLLVYAFLFTIFSVGFDLIGPLIQRNIIDNYIVVENFAMDEIMRLMALFILFALLNALFKYFGNLNFHKVGNHITQDIRMDVFEKLQVLGMCYYDQTPVGSIVSRVTNDTEGIQDMFIHVISVILVNVIKIVGILFVMFRLNRFVASIIVIFIPISILFVYFYQKYSTQYYQLVRERNSDINTKLSESISGMKIIQEFNQQERMIKEFSKLNEEYYEASIMNMKIDALLLSPIIHILTMMAIAILLIYAGLTSLNGVVIVGTVLAFVDLIYRLFDPLFQIMDRLAIYQQALVSSSRVFKLMDEETLAPVQNSGAIARVEFGKIEFRNVSFSYDGKHEVLKNISFVVEPGETLAIVGHTGSGKSSLINVMMRFYDFYEGEILIDDVSILDYPIEELRNRIALVLQDPFIFYGTVNDNVRLSDSKISDRAIQKACELVQADRFIDKLPKGYESLVSEGGTSFSEGQKQLLSFARAIVDDPKILILDEATANIDTETESLIQEGLQRIRENRTTLMIAHRLSTIKDANQIIVLDQGEIKEFGTHQELILQNGLYKAMVDLQNSAIES